MTTTYTYDAVGNRTQIRNPKSEIQNYTYDALNRRLTTTDPLNNVTRTGYDLVGNRTVITDANGIVTTFAYDPVNRLTTIDYSDSTPDVTFTYDSVGNRLTMTDGVGQTVYDYDDLYRLIEVTQPAAVGGQPSVVGYSYDVVGNRTSLTYPDGKSVTYTYDDANRLETITPNWGDSQPFAYTFDPANRLTDFSRPNGVTSTLTYDAAGRPIELTHQTATEVLARYEHELDKVGNRTLITETLLNPLALPPGVFLENDGLVVAEAEHYGSVLSHTIHAWLTATTQSGYTGTAYLQALPDIDLLLDTNVLTTSPTANYPIHFTTPGTYTVWSRGHAPNGAGDSLHVGLNG